MAAWQVDRDLRTTPQFARNYRGPASRLGEFVDLGQADPGPVPDVLRREERVEDLRQHVGSDADPGVANRDGDEVASRGLGFDAAAERRIACREGQRAAIRHGIPGIAPEIENCELERPDVDPDRPETRRDIKSDRDI